MHILPIKSGLDWLKTGQFWSFCRFFHQFPPKWGSDWLWNGQFSPDLHQTFRTGLIFCHLSHLIFGEISRSALFYGGYISKFFEFLNFFKLFHTREAQNDPQWQILPKSGFRLAQNSSILVILQVFPSFPPKSVSDLPWVANHPIHNFSHLLPPQYLIFGEISQIFILGGGGTSANFWVFQLFKIISHQIDSKWPIMANFATKVAWMSSKWAILVKFQQALKYLSGILTDLHRTFRTGLVFLRLVNMSPRSPRSVMLWSKLMKT